MIANRVVNTVDFLGLDMWDGHLNDYLGNQPTCPPCGSNCIKYDQVICFPWKLLKSTVVKETIYSVIFPGPRRMKREYEDVYERDCYAFITYCLKGEKGVCMKSSYEQKTFKTITDVALIYHPGHTIQDMFIMFSQNAEVLDKGLNPNEDEKETWGNKDVDTFMEGFSAGGGDVMDGTNPKQSLPRRP